MHQTYALKLLIAQIRGRSGSNPEWRNMAPLSLASCRNSRSCQALTTGCIPVVLTCMDHAGVSLRYYFCKRCSK